MLAYLPFFGDSRPARDSVLPGAVTGRDVLVIGSYRKPDLQESTTEPMHGMHVRCHQSCHDKRYTGSSAPWSVLAWSLSTGPQEAAPDPVVLGFKCTALAGQSVPVLTHLHQEGLCLPLSPSTICCSGMAPAGPSCSVL